MNIEFDQAKNFINKEKHGIDFIEAQALWKDEKRVVYRARTVDEPRFILIGKMGNVLWSAIYTMRDSSVRIISVRCSRIEERQLYEG